MLYKRKSTKLNSSKYCYKPLTIQLNTQFNDQTVLFQTIQFCISDLFALILNVKQFYLTFQVLPLWASVDLGVMAMKGALHSPKLLLYWSLTIRLFNVTSGTLIAEMQSVSFIARANWAEKKKRKNNSTSVYLSFLTLTVPEVRESFYIELNVKV